MANSGRVLIAGEWRESTGSTSFHAVNPSTGEVISASFPISPWDEIDAALDAATQAARHVVARTPEVLADFLERYAVQIEDRVDELVEAAHLETALPKTPRLRDVELPRTTNQLRLAATAAREGTWVEATIDTQSNIRSQFEPLGPIVIFGPNNFPFAFNAMSGGDFAAAIAAGNPVIAKAHPAHPKTTTLLADAAREAMLESGMPSGFVQMLFHFSNEDGLRLVADERIGGTAFTGSRAGGLALKQAADAAGKPIYLEMSSINPVVILRGALLERSAAIAEELTTSCLMGTGQFCTNPGLIILPAGPEADAFVADVATRFGEAPAGLMLTEDVRNNLLNGIRILTDAGAELVRGGEVLDGPGFRASNTLLQVTAHDFVGNADTLQTECFGNSTLFVLTQHDHEIRDVIESLEGNLTGCIYSDTQGTDDAQYDLIAQSLTRKVGRLLNDKMPTGVAVSSAMNHGGPYPATGHPGFTAVGIPAALKRFARLVCYDNIRPERLPESLKNANESGRWRFVDLRWTRDSIPD